jgi:hypothetical protein
MQPAWQRLQCFRFCSKLLYGSGAWRLRRVAAKVVPANASGGNALARVIPWLLIFFKGLL